MSRPDNSKSASPQGATNSTSITPSLEASGRDTSTPDRDDRTPTQLSGLSRSSSVATPINLSSTFSPPNTPSTNPPTPIRLAAAPTPKRPPALKPPTLSFASTSSTEASSASSKMVVPTFNFPLLEKEQKYAHTKEEEVFAKRVKEDAGFKSVLSRSGFELDLLGIKTVNMAYAMYLQAQDRETIKFDQKGKGITNGFIVSDTGPRLFVKECLPSETSTKSHIVELFVYKLLELMNFGPNIEAKTACDGRVPFLISHDLAAKGGKVLFGQVAQEEVKKRCDASPKEKVSIIALEILAKILEIGDVRRNLGNFALVVDGQTLKPFILDFHFSPSFSSEMLSPSGAAIAFSPLKKRLSENTPGATVGLTRSLAGSELTKAEYDAALELLKPFKEGVQKACDFCKKFAGQIADPGLRNKEFSLTALAEYQEKILKNIQTLNFDSFKKDREGQVETSFFPSSPGFSRPM